MFELEAEEAEVLLQANLGCNTLLALSCLKVASILLAHTAL